MSQTPPNGGWQGQGQPINGQGLPPQGPPPGYPGAQGPQGYGQRPPQQSFGPPTGQPYGRQPQNFGPPPGQPQNFGPQPGQPYGQQPPPQGYQQGGAPTRPRSKAKVIVASTLGVAVLAGAVGAGLFFFKGATPEAAKGLPADVAFAAEVNLAPSNADKLALKSIVDKYPSLKKGDGMETDYKKALFNILASDSSDAPDYDSEIKPWLGNSIALGYLGNPADGLEDPSKIVVAVATTDKGKAEDFIKKEATSAKTQFIDNLMIVTDASSDLRADDIKRSSLADSSEYKADMAKLGSGSLATVWFGSRLTDAALEKTSGTGVPGADSASLKGTHGAAGLQVTDSKLSLKIMMQSPNMAEVTGSGSTDLVKGMSGDAPFVIATETNDAVFDQLWSALEGTGNGSATLKEFGIESVDDLKALLGRSVGVEVSMVDGMPVVGAKLETDNPARQKEIFEKINALLEGSGQQLTLEQEGNTGIIAYGQSAQNVLSPSSKLGDLDAFRKVVDGKAQSVVFLNIEALKALPDYDSLQSSLGTQVAEVIEPMTSIGLVANSIGDHYTESNLHITFK